MNTERLKAIRSQKKVTQKEAADALGISPNTYKNYEQGMREPNNEMLCKLADYFQVTTDYLLGREPQTDAMQMLMSQTDVSPETLVRQFDALPDEWQTIVMTIINAMKETRRARQAMQSRPSIQMRKHLNKAAAGFGYDLSSMDEWTEITVLDTPQARAADFAVEVDGDSMLPDYHDGDIVLVKRDPDVPVGEVGLFVHEGMGYIKERGSKCLISRNPEFPNIEGEAQCIGLVIGIAETV